MDSVQISIISASIFLTFLPIITGFSEWIATEPLSRPMVTAMVTTDQWNLTSQTMNDESKLSVFEKSTLTIVCQAPYPVVWKKDDGKDLPQSRDDKSSNDGQLLSAQQYQTNITFPNFSSGQSGRYYCCMDSSGIPEPIRIYPEEFMATVVNLVTHSVSGTSKTAQIHQSGFDIIKLRPILSYQRAPPLRISVIHTVPSDADIDYILEQPPAYDQSGYPIPNGPITIENQTLTSGIAKVTTIISNGPNIRDGKYKLVIQTSRQNGEILNTTVDFEIRSNLVEHLKEAERLSFSESTILLRRGWLHEIIMAIPMEIGSARLMLQWRDLNTPGCQLKPISAKQAAENCGIYGFSLLQSPTGPNGVVISMRAWKPCALTVLITESTNSLRIDSKINRSPVSFNSTLYTTILDGGMFGHDFKQPNLVPTPAITRSGTEMFVGAFLTLNCFVPKCHHLGAVTWRRSGTKLAPFENDISKEIENYNGWNTALTISAPDNLTMNYALKFQNLFPEHTGDYACISPISSSVKRASSQFRVRVDQDRPPVFLTPNETEWLIENGSAKLTCITYGIPKPQIRWTWDGNQAFDFISHSEDDNETITVTQPGQYLCHARNEYGESNISFNVVDTLATTTTPIISTVTPSGSGPNSATAAGIGAGVGVGLVILFSALFLLYQCGKRRMNEVSLKRLTNALRQNSSERPLVPIDDSAPLNDQVQFLPYNNTLEIDRNLFTMSNLLGMGEFGSIYRGDLNSQDGKDARQVAIKIPKDPLNFGAYKALIDEMKIMGHIRPHVNVLSLIGACTQNMENKELYVLTEFCENGSLRDYLIKHAMKFEGFKVNALGQFTGSQGAVEALLNYAYQAANGMSHLTAEKIIHRDLALRNLLLTVGHIVKISDFGMSRQNLKSSVYKKRLSPYTPVPIFWMALESLLHDHYTQKSDVWSFGVVLWEMFSCGKRPYPDQEQDFNSFRAWLRASEKNRLGPPTIACEEMYHLMLDCWKETPEGRPSFSECKRRVARILEQRSPDMYQSTVLSLSEAWLNVPPTAEGRSSEGRASPAIVIAYADPRGSLPEPIPIFPTCNGTQAPAVLKSVTAELAQRKESDTSADLEMQAISDYSPGFIAIQEDSQGDSEEMLDARRPRRDLTDSPYSTGRIETQFTFSA